MEQITARHRRGLDSELQDFAEDLDLASFKALSPGIGIGEMRPRAGAAKVPGAVPKVAVTTGDKAAFRSGASAGVSPDRQSSRYDDAGPRVNKGTGREREPALLDSTAHLSAKAVLAVGGFTWGKRALALGIDFLFVGLTVTIALLIAVIFTAANGGAELSEPAHWLALAPVTWAANFSSLEILAGVYGIFAAYWLLFRFLAGGTLGESLLGKSRRLPAKLSGEALASSESCSKHN